MFSVAVLVLGLGTYWLTRNRQDWAKPAKLEIKENNTSIDTINSQKDNARDTASTPSRNASATNSSSNNPYIEKKRANVEKSKTSRLKSEVATKKIAAPMTKRSDLNLKRFVRELELNIKSLDDSMIDRAIGNILNSELLNPANVAVALSNSKNAKCAEMGMGLMTEICVTRPDLLKPNKFLVAFAKRGINELPRISRIIDETNDDFTREWACELYVETFYHNTPEKTPRHKKLAELREKEQEIYKFTREVVSNSKNLKSLLKKNEHPGEIIREQWGGERRYTLKMLAILRAFDLLTNTTIEPIAARVAKIVDSNDMRYDILGRVNGKTMNRPPIPLTAKLRVLSSAVFKNKHQNTDKWISRQRNGFTIKELEFAVESRDSRKMRSMYRALRGIIGNVLRGKLPIGLGNKEILLLRHFDQATLDGKPFRWSEKALTLTNESGGDVRLTIKRQSAESGKKFVKFTLFKNRKMVWFTPKGEFVIQSTSDSPIKVEKTTLPLTKNDFTLVIRKKK